LILVNILSNVIGYKVSVQDVINSNKKVTDDWGVEGYNLPKYNAHLDKPITYKIPKGTGASTNFIA
jgi:hypothetical protein